MDWLSRQSRLPVHQDFLYIQLSILSQPTGRRRKRPCFSVFSLSIYPNYAKQYNRFTLARHDKQTFLSRYNKYLHPFTNSITTPAWTSILGADRDVHKAVMRSNHASPTVNNLDFCRFLKLHTCGVYLHRSVLSGILYKRASYTCRGFLASADL